MEVLIELYPGKALSICHMIFFACCGMSLVSNSLWWKYLLIFTYPHPLLVICVVLAAQVTSGLYSLSITDPSSKFDALFLYGCLCLW